MLAWLQHRWTCIYLLILGVAAFMLFMYGFFPLKYHSGKISHMHDLPSIIDEMSIDGREVYDPGENSVILMVIDGLRYDFVTEEYMSYTAQLLKNKSACIYTTVAEPPTVTMPRIKAMMTGTVSTFADVALNFGAPAVRGDSVLRAASARGRRTILYGDDTWLRLFPGTWSEADGTTSFYVTDYTEVDNNVTRHLNETLAPDEEMKPKFDFLVLHYLGLDHIGHLEGARSSKIKPKLKEMDQIVKQIHTAMNIWDRSAVLFICGDHGMRDAGGHGGATPAEVLVPLVVAPASDFTCPHPLGPGPIAAQVDVAPTISWLLDIPIPGESTGRILPCLMPFDIRQHLYLLHVVASQNVRNMGLTSDKELHMQLQRASSQFVNFLVTKREGSAKLAKEFYEEALDEMAKILAENTVQFDLFVIWTGIVLMFCVTASLLCITLYSFQPDTYLKHVSIPRRSTASQAVAFLTMYLPIGSIFVTSCFISETKSPLCTFDPYSRNLFALIACVFTMAYFFFKTTVERTRKMYFIKDLNVIDYLLIGGTLFHAWSFFGTSFIEEEHMTWYFFWNTLMFFVLIKSIVVVAIYLSKKFIGSTEVQEKRELAGRMLKVGVDILPRWVLLIALHRYLRTLNQTGDRWLFLPDTADWLNAPENAFYLQLHLLVGTLLTIAICLYNVRYMNNQMYRHTIFTIAASICIFLYRIANQALYTPFENMKHWDNYVLVDIFWLILTAQFVTELVSYMGDFKICGDDPSKNNSFVYKAPKAKTEDYYEEIVEEPWNVSDVKLNLARSLSHLMLNDMMLIIILLMRPHNVVLVPSVYITCRLTSKCMDHKLLDALSANRTEIADILSRTLVHLWIGSVFFFYQGNSNSLASVDLGAGYVGLRTYCPVRVALRMGLHAYAGPALAGATLFTTIAIQAQTWHQYLQTIWRASNIFAFHRLYTITVYLIITTFFRHHLYVWTVFSPKILYDFVALVFTMQALLTVAEIILMTHMVNRLAKMFTYRPKL